MDWNSPATKKHVAEAKAQGCELIGEGRNGNYRTYNLPCGHDQEVRLDQMRNGVFRCQTCLNSKMKGEAEAQGCELLGRAKDVSYRNYRLPCGHEQEIALKEMRHGQFRCRICLNDKWNTEAEVQGCRIVN